MNRLRWIDHKQTEVHRYEDFDRYIDRLKDID